ncbi:hypothetical protein N0V90_008067 [Kalmusia sp. IMI 367209]|nr:hypothetical protein N0V90_008067 [Kalmusia sp. IMI 367209]
MASQQPEKPRGLPNPYGAKGLPNPYAAATVAESAPVKFSEEQAKAEKKTPASAFHNPHHIKRPQAKGSAVKKPAIARPIMSTSSSSDPAPTTANTTTISQQPGLDWWRSTADDDAAALDYKREMDRVQREKKKQEKKFAKQFGWWKGEAPYKADRPSNLRAYRASGSYRYKLDSFADFIQAQASPVRSRKASSEHSPDMPSASSASPEPLTTAPKSQFAPPSNYDQDRTSNAPTVDEVHIDEDPYARRWHAATTAPSIYSLYGCPSPSPPTDAPVGIPPPPPPTSTAYNPTISAPPVRYNPTISAPPVRYDNATISAPPIRFDAPEISNQPPQEERPAKRPKLSKAEAMMAKMGYVKGKGLGKNNDGITTHLEVKARKGDKRVDTSDDYDDEKARNIKSQQVFDILGGHTTKRKEPDKFGQESKVIVAWGCVDGIDWTTDADRDDGGIRQEMGQTFDDKFGRVERVYVNLSGESQPVYIKFASELSALNAVNRFHEGYQFRGRNIRAQYYSEAKFEASVFDH